MGLLPFKVVRYILPLIFSRSGKNKSIEDGWQCQIWAMGYLTFHVYSLEVIPKKIQFDILDQ